MAWKRGEFNRTGKKLIEFYDYERREGTLEALLEARLTGAGVQLRSMTLAGLEKILGDTKYIGTVIEKQLAEFIENARSFRMPTEQILQRLKSATPRVHHFGNLGLAVLQRYERELASEDRIDFSDMLHRAADILEKGASSLPKSSHVPVDEILVLSRTNHIIDGIRKGCQSSGIPVANPVRDTSGVRILSAHKAKGLEANVVVIANASDHLFGFPSKMENSDVLEPVRMSAGNGPAEERRLFYVAVTRGRKRLHLISRQGHPSPYIEEIEGGYEHSQQGKHV